MRSLRALFLRLTNPLRAQRIEDDFAAELESHIAIDVDDGVRAGLSAEEARRQALIRIGGAEQARQRHRERRTLPWFQNLLRDLRYALRGFRRNPMFTFTAIATLALGIGATTAVFSVVDRILFRPLPYTEPARIVSLGFVHSLEREEFLMGRFYLEWQKDQKPFSAIASQDTGVHNCDLVENNPAQLSCISFQAGFLPLLGISPILGRNFLPEEDLPNGPRVVMISYGLWKGHYNEDLQILDSMINVDGSPARVVGVLPKEFQFPTLDTADIVFPMALNPALQQRVNGGFGIPMRVFARLKPGVGVAQAYAQMLPLVDSERSQFPASAFNEVRLSIRSLRDRETQDVRPVAWILFGFVLAVLLIACANVASLMMARGAARQRELAVRSAIGASRGRLIRQALTEALLLFLAGGLVGLATARGLVAAFVGVAPTEIPFINAAHLDLRIAVFTVLLSSICGIVFGLASALQKPGFGNLHAKASMSRSHALLRRGLVIAQIAISIVLLSSAALLLRSFEKIEAQNLGMQTGGVLAVKAALPWFRYNTNQKSMDFYLRLETAIRRLPGTRAVGIADSIPPGGWQGEFRYADLLVQGKPRPIPGTGGTIVSRDVTPDYFRALNIAIVHGRSFAEQDRTGDEREAVISRLLAARLFPGEDPIGKRLQAVAHYDDAWFSVVGVADNVKNSKLTEQSDPEIYFLRRSVSDDWNGNRVIIFVDSVMPPASIESWVRSEIASIDRTVPVDMMPLNHTISQLANLPRFETALLAFFALTGLTLAVTGLYGVIAYLAAQRTQEIGVRMALGATRFDILRLIVGEGVRLISLGGILGLVAALAAAQLLKSLLFHVGTHDPFSFVAVTLLLSVVALAATLIPARAAMKIDPMTALRAE